MPELPEVETIKRGLEKVLIGKKISRIQRLYKKQFYGNPRLIYQKSIKGVQRRAKVLVFQLPDIYLLVHLKMSGQLIYAPKGVSGKLMGYEALKKLKNTNLRSPRKSVFGPRRNPHASVLVIGGHPEEAYLESLPNRYTRAIFHFSDGSRLYFNDTRKFGWIKLLSQKQYQEFVEAFGPEALAITAKELGQRVATGRGSTIKQFLLNQENLAGVGNIYADEALFCARINPFRLTKTLKLSEIKRLAKCIRQVLQLALRHQGTSERFYRTASGGIGTYGKIAKVYGREGQLCRNCQSKIVKKKLGGRSSHFCPKCQK